MQNRVEDLVDRYETGSLTRRELIAGLLALSASPGTAIGAPVPQNAERIGVAGLDHIALRVSDLARSKRFYLDHLGVSILSESENNVMLRAGRSWIALFNDMAVTSGIARPPGPGMDHFAFSTSARHSFDALMATLRARNLNPVSPGATRRIYFRDPDGIVVQLSTDGMS